jgi:hypothetical protein
MIAAAYAVGDRRREAAAGQLLAAIDPDRFDNNTRSDIRKTERVWHSKTDLVSSPVSVAVSSDTAAKGSIAMLAGTS